MMEIILEPDQEHIDSSLGTSSVRKLHNLEVKWRRM